MCCWLAMSFCLSIEEFVEDMFSRKEDAEDAKNTRNFLASSEPLREWCGCSRRQVVRSLFTGSMLFPAVLQQLFADGDDTLPRAPHFPAKAKRVIFMYM